MFTSCSHHVTDCQLRHPELPPVSFGLQCLLRAKKQEMGRGLGLWVHLLLMFLVEKIQVVDVYNSSQMFNRCLMFKYYALVSCDSTHSKHFQCKNLQGVLPMLLAYIGRYWKILEVLLVFFVRASSSPLCPRPQSCRENPHTWPRCTTVTESHNQLRTYTSH